MRLKIDVLNADFAKLWTGETISLFGSQITTLALPLTAIVLLNASPAQMGILSALGFMPFLFVTLFAGVWIDQRRRKPVLLFTNFGRAFLLLLVPLLAALNILRIEQLYVIVFLVGILNIMFELAYQSYIPVLMPREQLVNANSRLFASASVAEIGGPGLAGALIEILTAPFALLLDAVTFLVAGFCILGIGKRELVPPTDRETSSVWQQIRSGLSITVRNPYLRAFAGEAASYNFCNYFILTMFVLYATRDLQLSAGVIGLIFGAGSIGALLGAITTNRIAQRISIGKTILLGAVISCIAPLMIPFASGQWLVPMLIGAYAVTSFGVSITNVHTFSIRQAIIPDAMRGRINASYRFISWGVIPIGAYLSGILGEHIGARGTILLGALGLTLVWLWFALTPVRHLRTMPPMIDESIADQEAKQLTPLHAD